MLPDRLRLGRLLGFLPGVCLLFAAAPAAAQANYRLAPVGGRSQLLGGTGMTFGRDASAAFLNPGTAVLIDDQRLSFSVNFYAFSLTNVPNWYTPGPVDRSKFGDVQGQGASLSSIDFEVLPSSLCLFYASSKLNFIPSSRAQEGTKDARLGFCFATVQDEAFNFSAEQYNARSGTSVTRQAQTLTQKFTRFVAGPTYAVRITNGLSVGASLHASVVTSRNILTASAASFGGASAISSSFYSASKGTSFQVDATVGAVLRFGKQTVGLSLRAPSAPVYGRGGVNQAIHYDGAGSDTQLLLANGTFIARSPTRIGLGTGVEGAWGELAVDSFYFFPLSSNFTADLTGTQTRMDGGAVTDRPVHLLLGGPAHGVVNFAVGGDFVMSPKVNLLTGFSTDTSAIPSGALKGNLFNYTGLQTNHITGSLGLGAKGDRGEIMLGAELTYGWGDRLAVNSYQLPPDIATTSYSTVGLMFVVAGSTNFRALKKVVDDVKQIVTTPAPLTPATNPTPQKPVDPIAPLAPKP